MIRHYGKVARGGITAVEVVIGVSILALVVTMTMLAITQFLTTGRELSEKTAAIFLAEDGLELVRFVRDNDWTDLSGLALGSTHYLSVTPTNVSYTNTPEVIGNFTRSFTVANVYRDPLTDDIVPSTAAGSVADTNAKYVTVTVSWGTPVRTVSLATILANLDP